MTKPLALIVEDDSHLGQIFQITLQVDFDTEIIVDGAQAVKRLAQMVPDLIVLDLNLPGLHGKDVLRWLRSNPRFKDTCIILCTADAIQAEMLQGDVDVVLLKPVSPLQLRGIAARLMQMR